jgi:O-antigen ligase
MEMLLPISVVYIFSRVSNPILRILLWSGVIFVIISIWVGGSRGATLVLLIEGVLLTGILMWRRPSGFSPRYLVVLLGVVLISAAGFSWLVRTGHVVDRAWSVFATNQSLGVKLGDRFRVGVDTFHMARSHPWVGVGLGCFEYVFPNYLTFPMDLRWIHAHDDVLEAAAETGLPGVVIMVVAVVLFFRMAFRHLDRRLRHGWGWIQLGAAVSTVGLLCHSFVDFNLRVPANAAWFVVCLAIATQPFVAREKPRKSVGNSSAGRNREFLT